MSYAVIKDWYDEGFDGFGAVQAFRPGKTGGSVAQQAAANLRRIPGARVTTGDIGQPEAGEWQNHPPPADATGAGTACAPGMVPIGNGVCGPAQTSGGDGVTTSTGGGVTYGPSDSGVSTSAGGGVTYGPSSPGSMDRRGGRSMTGGRNKGGAPQVGKGASVPSPSTGIMQNYLPPPPAPIVGGGGGGVPSGTSSPGGAGSPSGRWSTPAPKGNHVLAKVLQSLQNPNPTMTPLSPDPGWGPWQTQHAYQAAQAAFAAQHAAAMQPGSNITVITPIAPPPTPMTAPAAPVLATPSYVKTGPTAEDLLVQSAVVGAEEKPFPWLLVVAVAAAGGGYYYLSRKKRR